MTTIRARREPPPLRPARVVGVARRSERLVRLTLEGAALAGLDPGLPAASVRLLVPDSSEQGGAPAVALPTWNGNEFRRADGTRPPIRTLTPVRFAAEANELVVEVVLHGDGPLSTWVAGDPLGDPTAVSGTGRGYTIDPDAAAFVLAGDESAVPALSVVLDALAEQLPAVAVTVIVEATEPVAGAEIDLPSHPNATVRWRPRPATDPPGVALLDAIVGLDLAPGTRVWAAGEAAGVHRIRQHLFEQRSLPRAHAVVRGYWKQGRGGDDTT